MYLSCLTVRSQQFSLSTMDKENEEFNKVFTLRILFNTMKIIINRNLPVDVRKK